MSCDSGFLAGERVGRLLLGLPGLFGGLAAQPLGLMKGRAPSAQGEAPAALPLCPALGKTLCTLGVLQRAPIVSGHSPAGRGMPRGFDIKMLLLPISHGSSELGHPG